MLEDIEIEEIGGVTSTLTENEEIKKRKTTLRSDMWEVFTKVFVEVGDPPEKAQKGKCSRCDKLIAVDPKINGITSMWKHHQSCSRKHAALTQGQTMLNQEVSGSLTTWRFNQEACRIALCKMIILDELPFRFVERGGFKQFMRAACPQFKILSRTIRADCVKMFVEKKEQVKVLFNARGMGRVSITTNCWTSINNTNFICVKTHCIDKDWKLHKKIINFSKICSHRGKDLAAAVMTILEEWGDTETFMLHLGQHDFKRCSSYSLEAEA